ncbi:MAG: hypothetical protein M3P48_05590, partial [Actinomycetota bacterium]|nr:hypothetical protein [Actinomycetota bacterium]
MSLPRQPLQRGGGPLDVLARGHAVLRRLAQRETDVRELPLGVADLLAEMLEALGGLGAGLLGVGDATFGFGEGRLGTVH